VAGPDKETTWKSGTKQSEEEGIIGEDLKEKRKKGETNRKTEWM
jgi:hypothetical protein